MVGEAAVQPLISVKFVLTEPAPALFHVIVAVLLVLVPPEVIIPFVTDHT